MTTPDLAAAERLRRINNGETHRQVYSSLSQWSSLEHDRMHLADAFLARLDQEREGSEKVTPEWLTSLGFEWDAGRQTWTLHVVDCDGIDRIIEYCRDNVFVAGGFGVKCKTRSDVLALLRALKVRE